MRSLWSISWRFMLRGTEKGTFSPMTLFAWIAIAVGVWAMGTLLSVMYGFEGALKDRVLNAYPHLMIRNENPKLQIPDYEAWTQKLSAVKGIERAVPYIETEMILQSEARGLGVVVWGVPESEFKRMKLKEIKGLIPTQKSKLPGLILGSELASRLHADIGSQVKMISPLAKASGIAGTVHGETYEVVGLYTSGHYDFDQQFSFVLLSDAQDLLRWKNVISGWHLWGKSPDEALVIKDEIKAMLPPDWYLEGWDVFNSALFNSLKWEQYAMFFILSFAVAIAVLNIVITLMMHVSHKRKNIGILSALGASRKQIRQIFVRQGFLLGGVGLVIAALLTIASIAALRIFPFMQLPAYYYDRSIPVEIRPLAFVVIYGASVVMIFLATIFPAMKAAATDPIAAIRE